MSAAGPPVGRYLASPRASRPRSGGAYRFVGGRFADNANAITMRSYGTFDAYLAWTAGRVRATARVDNLTDAAYASWSDVFYLGQTDPSFLYSNQLMLGAPRSFSVLL